MKKSQNNCLVEVAYFCKPCYRGSGHITFMKSRAFYSQWAWNTIRICYQLLNNCLSGALCCAMVMVTKTFIACITLKSMFNVKLYICFAHWLVNWVQGPITVQVEGRQQGSESIIYIQILILKKNMFFNFISNWKSQEENMHKILPTCIVCILLIAAWTDNEQ